MRQIIFPLVAMLSIATHSARAEVPVSLRGSPASMVRQNQVAKGLDFPFVRTVSELRELVDAGDLVRLEGNADYEIAEFVSHPVGREAMLVFVERLAAQYHAATGEKLVVTSLTRPTANQPRNSHELSVHPTGMAVDFRVSQKRASREWMEETLLSLERQGLLDITREYNPPHYHVALFADAYMTHVAQLEAREAEERRALAKTMTVLAPITNALVTTEPLEQPGESETPASTLVAVLLVGAGLLVSRLRSLVVRPR